MEEENKFYTIILRHDTSTQWLINNPVLALGEYGVEDDTHRLKRGDGVSTWEQLSFETFGIEKVTATEAMAVAYDNTKSQIKSEDVQSAIDYIIQELVVLDEEKLIKKLDKSFSSNVVKNIVNKPLSENELLLLEIENINPVDKTTSVNNIKITSLDKSITATLQADGSINLEAYVPTNINYYTTSVIIDDVIGSINQIDINTLTGIGSDIANIKSQDIIVDKDNTQCRVESIDLTTNIVTCMTTLKATPPVWGKITGNIADQVDLKEALDDKVSNKSFEEYKTSTNDTISDLNNDINTNTSDIANIKAEAETIKSDVKTNKESISALDTDLAKAEEQIETNKANIATNTKDIATNKVDITERVLKTEAKSFVKDVKYASDTCTLTFTMYDNSILEIDLPLEGTVKSGYYDDASKSIKLVLVNNTEISIPAQSLIDVYSSEDSDQIQLSISSSNVIKAILKTNSIKEEHLSTELKNRLTKIETDISNNTANITTNANEIKKLADKDVEIDTTIENIKNSVKTNSDNIQTNTDTFNGYKEYADNKFTQLDEKDTSIMNNILATNTKVAQVEASNTKNQTDITNLAASVKANTEAIEALDSGSSPALEQVKSDIKTNADNITALETNTNTKISELETEIETSNKDMLAIKTSLESSIEDLAENKLDNTFTDNIVTKIENNDIQNNEVLNLKVTNLEPKDNVTYPNVIKMISSDNTIIAKKQEDGSIDISANLDTDVNYFITSVSLDSTISQVNTIALDTLTSTIKETVEVQDIITDENGVWARVQSIDTENNTLNCITFYKASEAVWGVIKGSLEDQLDLKAALDAKIDKSIASSVVTSIDYTSSGESSDDLTYLKFGYTTKPTNGSGGSTHQPIYLSKSDSVKMSKSSGTNPTIYKFNVEAEGTTFDPQESGLTSELLAPAIRELKTLDDEKVKTTDFDTFKTSNQSALDRKVDKNFGVMYANTFTYTQGQDIETDPNDRKSILVNAIGTYNPHTAKSDVLTQALRSDDGAVEFSQSKAVINGINSVLDVSINSERIIIDPKDSGIESTQLGDALRELKSLDSEKLKTTDFETYKSEIKTSIDNNTTNITTLDGEITSLNEITETLDENISKANEKINTNTEAITNLDTKLNDTKTELNSAINEKANETALTELSGKVTNLETNLGQISVPEYNMIESETTEGYAKTYSLTKDNKEVGVKINIPKDLVISSGQVKVVETENIPYEGAIVGDKYLQLVLNDESEDVICIPVKDLVDIYTGKDTDKISLTVNDDNTIEATLVKGSIEKADLHTDLQAELNKSLKFTKNDGTIAISKLVTDIVSNEGISSNTYRLKIYGTDVLSNGYTGLSSYMKSVALSSSEKSIKLTELTTSDGVNIEVDAENVTFDAKESGITSTKLADAIREIKTSNDEKAATTYVDEKLQEVNTAIETNASDISTNTTNIADLTSKLNTTDSNLTDLGVKVNTNEQNISTNTTNIETNATNIETLETETTEKFNEVEEAITTTITTEVAKNHSISDCANVNAALDIVSGDTVQATRSGKNICDISKAYSNDPNIISLTHNDDGSITIEKVADTSGWHIVIPVDNTIFQPMSLYIKYKTEVSDETIPMVYFGNLDEQSSLLGYATLEVNTTSETSFTYTPIVEKQTIKAVCFSSSNLYVGDKITVYDIMVVGGDTLGEYEDYGASPSPEYSSKIRNVGDNVNLVDIIPDTTTTNGCTHTIDKINGTDILSGTSTDWANLVVYEFTGDGQEYTLSGSPKTTKNIYISAHDTVTNIDLARSKNRESQSFIATSGNLIQIIIAVGKGVTLENEIFKPKLELGNVATYHTPANCGGINFKLTNKNKYVLEDVEESQSVGGITYSVKDQVITLNGTSTGQHYVVLPLKYKILKGTYTISTTVINGSCTGTVGKQLNLGTSAKIDGGHIDQTVTFTAETDLTITHNAFYIGAGAVLDNYQIKIQLEEGEVQTEHINHEERIETFPFVKNQILHKTDYLSENGIHRNRRKFTFKGDSSESNWAIATDVVTEGVTRVYFKKVATYLSIKVNTGTIISSHFPYSDTNDKDMYISDLSPENIYFGIKNEILGVADEDTSSTKLAAWKNWLQTQNANNTPLQVEAEALEEEIIPYTSAQQEVYNKLQHLIMYEGYTSIECMDEIKPDIQVTYYKYNQINTIYAERLDNTEKHFKQVELSIANNSLDILNNKVESDNKIAEINIKSDSMKTTDIAKDLNVSDSAPVKAKLSLIKGESYQLQSNQDTNLFTGNERKPDAILNCTCEYHYQSDSIYVKPLSIDTAASISYNMQPYITGLNNNLVITFEARKASSSTPNLSVTLGSSTQTVSFRTQFDEYSIKIPSDAVTAQSNLQFSVSNTTYGFYIRKIMIKIDTGSSIIYYQPRLITPCIDTPSAILNVGSNINIFNPDEKVDGLSVNTSQGTFSAVDDYCVFVVSVKPNIYYTYSRELVDGYTSNITYGFSESYPKLGDAFISSGTIKYNISADQFMAPYNANFMWLVSKISDASSKFNKMRIVEGYGAETIYTPYDAGSMNITLANEDYSKFEEIYFPFTSGQRFHKNDYLAFNGIHQNRMTLILDGTENLLEDNTQYDGFFSASLSLPLLKLSEDSNDLLCTHLNQIAFDDQLEGITKSSLPLQYSLVIFRVSTEKATDIDSLKALFAEQYTKGTPVTIEYPLAEEIVVPYTLEQQKVYDKLQNIMMYESCTNIHCMDDVKPNMQLSYYTNNTLNNAYASRLDHLESVQEDIMEFLPPIIKLEGDNPLYVIKGTEYLEPGASILNHKYTSSLEITNNIDINTVGEYEVVYTAINAQNNDTTSKTRKIIVYNNSKTLSTTDGYDDITTFSDSFSRNYIHLSTYASGYPEVIKDGVHYNYEPTLYNEYCSRKTMTLKDGKYTVIERFNGYNSRTTLNFLIDTTGPEQVQGVRTGRYYKPVTLIFPDPSDLGKAELTNSVKPDDVFDVKAYLDNNNTNTYTVSENGTYTLYMEDKYGNSARTISFRLQYIPQ